VLFFATLLVSICFGLLSTLRPLLIQYVFDKYIIVQKDGGLLMMFLQRIFEPLNVNFHSVILIILALLLLEASFQFIFIFRSNYIAQKIIQNIRLEVFSKITSFRINYFDRTPTGQLITRVISDMEAISAIFSQGLLVVCGDLFKMILIISCMFFISWELTLISLLWMPLLIISTIIFQKYMQKAFLDVRKYISKINVFVYEHIMGMHVVQMFGAEKRELESFKKINALHREAHVKTVLYFSIFLPIIDVFSAIAMGLLVWYGATNIISPESSITVGKIIAFILFINMLFRPLRSIADKFNVLQMGMVASSRVFDIINRPISQDFLYDDASIINLNSGKISFQNVYFSYKENEVVLNDVSFTVNKNETLAIVGPTGSGKTTIINLIMKWYDVSSGIIQINDDSISNISPLVLRKSIGVVLQDTFFMNDTLMSNIKFFNNISDERVYQAVEDIGLQDFINKFPNKYEYCIGERGAGLSEGEKQLVSFLRTYLLNPAYFILDEATSSMDPATERLIQKAVIHVSKSRTSIIIAHRLSTIQNADKIIVLENGELIESGSHQDLINLNSKYANYYYQQFMNYS